MVNAPKENFLPLLAGKYGLSTKCSTRLCHLVNEGKSGLEAERVRALGALRSLRSKQKLAAAERWVIHFLRNQEKEKWIEDYVERQTAVARKWVEDPDTVIEQKQKDMRMAENMGLTTREPEEPCAGMMIAIGYSLSEPESSDNEEDGEDDDDKDTVLGKLSKDDEPGWVVGTLSKMVQQRMKRYWQKQMKLD